MENGCGHAVVNSGGILVGIWDFGGIPGGSLGVPDVLSVLSFAAGDNSELRRPAKPSITAESGSCRLKSAAAWGKERKAIKTCGHC